MKRTRILFLAVLMIGLLAFSVLWGSTVPVAAGPAAQVTLTPRPKLTPTPGAASSMSSSAMSPPRLRGTIFDWGKGNMPAGVKVVLRGDGWEVPVQTGENGEYLFQDIGAEIAFLNVYVPDDRGDLFALTSDLPVRIELDKELIVNVAFYPKGVTPDPLIHLKVVASASEVGQDENVSYTITVINNWDQGVNQVIVADYLPQGVSYVSATASQGSALFDRGLVWADLGPMAAGDSATVTIMARVDGDVEPGTVLVNQVAAYHSENAAVQNEAPIEVVKHSNGVLPVTGVTSTLPIAGLFLVMLVFLTRRLRRESI